MGREEDLGHTGFDMVAVYGVGKHVEIKHAGEGKASPYGALWGKN